MNPKRFRVKITCCFFGQWTEEEKTMTEQQLMSWYENRLAGMALDILEELEAA